MSIECMAWVLKQTEDLSTSEKFVLLGVANHASPDGDNSFPSIDTICRYTLLSRSTVLRAISSLCDNGFLTKVGPGGGRASNKYKVRMLDPDERRGPQKLVEVLVDEPVVEVVKERPRNEIWDAIMSEFCIDDSKLNGNERSRYGKVVKLLKESGAVPAEIPIRARVYRQKYRDVVMTPMALANNWSELNPEALTHHDVAAPKGFSAIEESRRRRLEAEAQLPAHLQIESGHEQ